MESLTHAAERKAYEVAIRQAVRYIRKEGTDRSEQMGKLIDFISKMMGGMFAFL